MGFAKDITQEYVKEKIPIREYWFWDFIQITRFEWIFPFWDDVISSSRSGTGSISRRIMNLSEQEFGDFCWTKSDAKKAVNLVLIRIRLSFSIQSILHA